MRLNEELTSLLVFAVANQNAFHTSEAERHDVPARRLRRARQAGVVANLHRRVWAFESLPAVPGQTIRAATLARPMAAASGLSAAWLHGWVDRPPAIPQIWVPYNSHGRVHGVDIRRCDFIEPEHDLTAVGRIPTLGRAATLVLLGSVANDDIVARCLDEFTRSDSVTWLHETLERAVRARARGRAALIRALEDPRRVAGVTDSWMERVLSSLLAVPGLPSIVLQHPVIVDGRRYRIDIACPELRLGIEAHSRTYHWGPEREDADNVRDLALAAAGWQVLYVTWAQIQEPAQLVSRFVAAARARARERAR